jgi:hypothetical protein
MIVPVTATDALVAFVFFFFSLSFIALGMVGLGKGKPEGAGTVFTLVGIIEAVLGFIIIYANLDSPVFIAVGLLVLIFAFTWLAAGVVNLRGYDLVPLGNACGLSGLMMFPFAAFFVINSELFTTIGWIWLVVNVVSWVWAFWSVTLAAYGKIRFPVVGWTFLIQAFYTLLIPAALLLMGVFSLHPPA